VGRRFESGTAHPEPAEVDAAPNTRARALIAIGGLVALGALIAVVLVAGSGSDEEREFSAAPQECVDLWNSDDDALNTGVHNALAHAYSRVQVAYASEDGSELADTPVDGGGCIVVFAASQLDPEPIAAAEINLDGSWTPLSGAVETARLAELQSEALDAANAELGQDGRISPL
jgi:hypothetical protein